MKKCIIICILCSCATSTLATPCFNVAVPDSCQNCATKQSKKTCKVTCKSCPRADTKCGPETKIILDNDVTEDIKIIINDDGELEIEE
jgi:hypothetical protein